MRTWATKYDPIQWGNGSAQAVVSGQDRMVDDAFRKTLGDADVLGVLERFDQRFVYMGSV